MNHQFDFSFYSNPKAVTPEKSTTIRELAQTIASDKKIKAICGEIKEVLSNSSLRPEEMEATTKSIKRKLPCVTASLLSDSRESGAPLGSHSGLIQVDIDMKDNHDKEYPELRKVVESHPSTCLVFKSPRGGVKALLRVPQVPDDQLTKESNHAASETLRAWFLDQGVVMDVMKDVKKLCYISHDPKPFYRDPNSVEELEICEDPILQEGSGERIEYRVKGKELRVKIKGGEREERDPFDESLRCKEQFKQDQPKLYHIYFKHIEHQFPAIQGERNTTLLKLVNYLYKTTPEENIKTLAMAFYDFNSFEFLDTRKDHARDVDAMTARLPDLWLESLSANEREAWEKIHTSSRMVKAFRVCQALAHYKPATDGAKEKWSFLEDRCFALSEAELEKRIGIEGNGGKILRSFLNKKFIQRVKLGTQNKATTDENGKVRVKKGNPSTYKWIL